MTHDEIERLWKEHGVAKGDAHSETEYQIMHESFVNGAEVASEKCEGYEFNNVPEPTCAGWWWWKPEGVLDWVIIFVYRQLYGTKLIIIHNGNERCRVGSRRYEELYKRARWTGPILTPEAKPRPSEDEERENERRFTKLHCKSCACLFPP